MAFYRCRICDEDGEEKCKDVTVSIETTDRDGETGWYGTVTVPHLTSLDAGKRYRLELEDGRSGSCTVRRSTFAGGESRAVAVVGVGPLS